MLEHAMARVRLQTAQRVRQMAESATLAVSSTAARMRAEGIDVVGLAAGEPDFPTPDHIRRAGIAAIEAGHTGYSKPTSGIREAKEAVCTKFERENGVRYATDQVIITAGAKMAVHLAVEAVVDPGDEVVIPSPYWVSYPEIVRLAGGVPVHLCGPEENGFKLTPEVLRDAITDRTRAVVFNSPSNPGGIAYAPEEVRALGGVLAACDVWVLSDEIYDRLVHTGHETMSLAAVGGALYDRTITINGASKTYAMTGWRAGYAAGDREVIRAMAKLQSQSTSGAATFVQHALAAALTSDQSAVEEMRRAFTERGAHMWRRLCAMPGIRCYEPNGAFNLFPNVAASYERLGVSGSAEFARKLLEEAKVAVVPGVAFGHDDHVRVSFATGMAQIDKGLDRIERFLSG